MAKRRRFRAAALLSTPNAESNLTHNRRESRRCPVFGDVAEAIRYLLVPKYFEPGRAGGRASSRVVVLHVPDLEDYPAHPTLLAIVVEILRGRTNHIDLPQLHLGVINVLGQTGIVLAVDVVDAAAITVAGGELRGTADVDDVHVARLPVAPRGFGKAEHSVVVGQQGGVLVVHRDQAEQLLVAEPFAHKLTHATVPSVSLIVFDQVGAEKRRTAGRCR